MNAHTTSASSETEVLIPLDLINIKHNVSPIVLDLIAEELLQSAARLRANGFYGEGGRA